MTVRLFLCAVLAGCSGAVRATDPPGDTDTDTEPDLAAIVINEILASNDSLQSWTDDDGNQHFDDWLELYNPGGTAVDLEGYGVSDGGSPWFFPAGAEIPPGGHLIVWCSEADGPGYHADFKISQGGEVLSLSDAGGQVIDTVDMPEQTTDLVTYRAPDGSETWAFGPGTPGAPNPEE